MGENEKCFFFGVVTFVKTKKNFRSTQKDEKKRIKQGKKKTREKKQKKEKKAKKRKKRRSQEGNKNINQESGTMFKPKADKKLMVCKKYNATLDGTHREFLQEFEHNEKVDIPNLTQQLKETKAQLKNKRFISSMPISFRFELENKVQRLKHQISALKRKAQDYFMENNGYIFEYFENKQQLDIDTNTTVVKKGKKDNARAREKEKEGEREREEAKDDKRQGEGYSKKELAMFAMFRIPMRNEAPTKGKENTTTTTKGQEKGQGTEEKEKEEEGKEEGKHGKEDGKNKNDDNNKMNNNAKSTSNNVKKYLANINDKYLDMSMYVVDTSVCKTCNTVLLPIEEEGMMVCTQCGVKVPYLAEIEKPNYKEPPKEMNTYAYKRINHFREIVTQFQAKQTTHIAQEIYDAIEQQVTKERLEMHELTYFKMKEILRKLGFHKQYDNINYIKKNLFGIAAPIFSPQLENCLYMMFAETQGPYFNSIPKDKNNYMHYYYAMYKFCELVEEYDYLKLIPLLKDNDKIVEEDETWCKVCKKLGWPFIPTVPL